jgi:exopolyphosphatase/guanosine-5'-triphosphate,3'-diphosphate pyrophosphatase
MLIIEVLENGAYRLAEDAKYTIRLAEHMGPERTIKPAALQRAVEALRLFRAICDYHGVTRISTAATAAVRDAANQEEFLAALKERAGIDFRVLSREEEAYYGYLGVVNSTDVRDAVIVDLGGGSMEITALRGRRIADSVSLPLGSVNLSERFLDPDRPTEKQLDALEDHVRQRLKAMAWLEGWRGHEVIGIGGTCRTIGKIHQRLVNYPFDELHNYAMPPDEIAFIHNNLRSVGLEDRRAVPGLSKERADIIVGGMAVMVTLLRYLKAPRMRVSAWGLRDGIFYSSFLPQPVVDDVFAFSIDNIQRLYHLDDSHASRVADMAVSMFDQLEEVHDAAEEDRRLLWAAAKLHESGYFYDYHNRHSNTFYNIINGTIFGLSQMETYKVAVIAALYGAGGIKGKDGYLTMLTKDENRTLKRMGVILALANALDRSRQGQVTGVSCSASKSIVRVRPQVRDDGWIEMKTAEGLAQYFSKAFGRDLVVDGPEQV